MDVPAAASGPTRPARPGPQTQAMTNNLFLRRAAVAAGATVVAVVEFALLNSAAGVDLAVRSANSTRQITVAAVIVAAVVAALAGWALLAVLERRTDRSRVWWTSIAVWCCCCRSWSGHRVASAGERRRPSLCCT